MMAKQRPQPLQPYFPTADLANLKVFFSGRSAVVTIAASGTIPERQAVIIIVFGPAFRALDFIRLDHTGLCELLSGIQINHQSKT
jgi:hypothetical protein